MGHKEQILALWGAIHHQRWETVADFFAPGARILLHNTREQFTPQEFVRLNSEYPGDWTITVERVEELDHLIITVIRTQAGEASLHATSFFQMGEGGRITRLDEYWGDDGPPPDWRIQRHIGAPIRD